MSSYFSHGWYAVVILAGAFLLPMFSRGDEPVASPAEADDPVEQTFSQVTPVNQLLGQQVVGSDEAPIGKVLDVGLDLETGHVALLVVKLEGLDEQMAGCIAVPISVVQMTGPKQLKVDSAVLEPRLVQERLLPEEAYHESLNRGYAEEQYKLFKTGPYWVVVLEPTEAQKSESAPEPEQQVEVQTEDRDEREGPGVLKELDPSYQLTLLSDLEDIPLVNQSGQPTGKLVGFAAHLPSGQVAYAAVQLDEQTGKLYPIPLGAFEVGSPDKPWRIELTEQLIQNTPTFTRDRWPNKVERAWIEYVQVRYGHGPTSGVQKLNNR